MKDHKTIKNIIAIKTCKKFSPSRATPYYSPLFTRMAKGLWLVREAIKLGCEQVDLVLNGCKPIGVLSFDFS